jgi:hypothetical protein
VCDVGRKISLNDYTHRAWFKEILAGMMIYPQQRSSPYQGVQEYVSSFCIVPAGLDLLFSLQAEKNLVHFQFLYTT